MRKSCVGASSEENEGRERDARRDAKGRETVREECSRDARAYALTISGIFWQEYQSCNCVKGGERAGAGRGREERKQNDHEDGSLDVTDFGTIV